MTTLEMRAAMEARENAPAWPEPEQAGVRVDAFDPRVPSGARGVAKLAGTHGWAFELTYARGTAMVGGECAPGPVVASVLLRAQRAGERVAAVWITKPRATCPACGKLKTPTPTGLLAKHDKGTESDRDGQKGECAGSGQRATLNPITVADYAFSAAYVTEGPGWWTAHVPLRVSVTQLKACLNGSVASVAEALRSAKTQTPES